MSGGTRATIRWPPPDTTFLLKFVVRTLTIPRATSTRTRRQAPTRDEQEMDAPAGATSLDIVTTLFSDITVSVAAVYQPDEIPIEIEVVTPTTFSTPEGSEYMYMSWGEWVWSVGRVWLGEVVLTHQNSEKIGGGGGQVGMACETCAIFSSATPPQTENPRCVFPDLIGVKSDAEPIEMEGCI